MTRNQVENAISYTYKNSSLMLPVGEQAAD
jgi:hypothetical protein